MTSLGMRVLGWLQADKYNSSVTSRHTLPQIFERRFLEVAGGVNAF